MKIKIEKLVYRGHGVGDAQGKKIFVPFSAPGDVLDVEIIDDHGTYADAQITNVIEPSSCRVNPACPVFGGCGACQWQHLSYECQIEWKRNILIETLNRIGKLNVSEDLVSPTLKSPNEWHYRNRIQLHVDSKGQVGFYKAKSKEVVEFKECLIAEEDLNSKLNEMRDELRHRNRGISLRNEEGPSFSQINTAQNEQLKKILVEWLKEVPHDNVLELHAGSGNFTFSIASIARKVWASDIDGRAIRHAKDLKQQDNVSNIEFYCEPAYKTLKRYNDPYDTLVLDPPRKGAAEAIESILSNMPISILYISCDPATLARDLGQLVFAGYKLKRVMPVDMFPQTYHIESVSILTKG